MLTNAARRGQLFARFVGLPTDLPALTQRLQRDEPFALDAEDVSVTREVIRR